jgi:hypothetical protein
MREDAPPLFSPNHRDEQIGEEQERDDANNDCFHT